jgi:hypothetical protein
MKMKTNAAAEKTKAATRSHARATLNDAMIKHDETKEKPAPSPRRLTEPHTSLAM